MSELLDCQAKLETARGMLIREVQQRETAESTLARAKEQTAMWHRIADDRSGALAEAVAAKDAAGEQHRKTGAAWHELQDMLVTQRGEWQQAAANAETDRDTMAEALRQATADAAAMRASVEELVAAMRDYQMDVDDSPPEYHRAMMARAETALATDAGTRLLAQMAAMRSALERCQVVFALIVNYVSLGGAYETIKQVTQQSEAALAPAAGATLLMQMAVMEATILDVLTNWWDRIYPEDVFVAGPDCDEGVSEVVRLRKAMRDAITDSASVAYQREHERLLRIEAALVPLVVGFRAFLRSCPNSRHDEGTFMWAQNSSSGEAPGISAGDVRRLVAALDAKEAADA